MTDPAIEAAQRAWKQRTPPSELRNALCASPHEVAAAREALKPIRELYEDRRGDADESAELWVFLNRLAPLIFPIEELD